MKTITLTDEELELIYDHMLSLYYMFACEAGKDFKADAYFKNVKGIYKKVLKAMEDAQQAKSSDDNSVPHYYCKGGVIEILTKEESKELGGFLHDIISDYLDLTLLNVTDEVKQQAIRKANTYKRIYNKLIKPIYKVEE